MDTTGLQTRDGISLGDKLNPFLKRLVEVVASNICVAGSFFNLAFSS
ncbi:hypothetical protein [Rhizobium etli]|nr:hypothetical protein [Rhizobium etli]